MIIPVKRARVFLLESDLKEVLKLIQKKALMMITKSGDSQVLDVKEEEDALLKIESAIKHLKSFKVKKNFFEYNEVSKEDFKDIKEENIKFLNEVLVSKESLFKLKEEHKALTLEINTLTPFKNLSLNLNSMSEATYVKFYSGLVHENNEKLLLDYFNKHNIAYEKLGNLENNYYFTFVLLKEEESMYLNDIKEFDFKEVTLPNVSLTLGEYLTSLQERLAKLNKEEEILKETTLGYLKEIKRLYLLYDQTLSLKTRKLAPFLKTEETVILEGWLRVDEEAKLRELLKDYTFELELFETNEEPPTALKNNRFVRNFETITDSYNVPNHKELDPNPLMSIWYFLIFGIMLADMGYGLMLVIGGLLFLKLKPPKGELKKLVTVFYYCGYSTIIAGMLFGSLFGFSVDIGALMGRLFGQKGWTTVVMSPMDNPLEMLIFSLGLGVLHILSGLVMKVILSFKLKDPLSALADGISWILILLGLIFVSLNLAFNKQIFMIIGGVLAAVGALIILLLAGREKKNIFAKFTSGLGGLYGASGYLSDILSYSRVLALALSGAVIGFTFNLLAGMMHGSIIGYAFAVLIYIFGHIFNFAMNLLSAYIHDARLQYIEFYGKFYMGEGYKYQPLEINLKYLDNIGGNK
ncbi:MAG: V-type ATP synthase subunit I [Acholeplasmatales bacterium]